MSKAVKQRRFRKWKKYRRQCTKLTGQHVPMTMAASWAWIRAVYRIRDGIRDGKFYAMPPWHCPNAPIGNWERRMWHRVG